MVESRVLQIASNVFGIDPSLINSQTKSTDLKEWDSLAHLQLILEIEHEFKVRIKSIDIPGLTSIQKICQKVNDLLQVK